MKPGPSPNQHTAKPGPVIWPGWTDDPEGRCVCAWSWLDGVRQVKFANTACPVRHKERAG